MWCPKAFIPAGDPWSETNGLKRISGQWRCWGSSSDFFPSPTNPEIWRAKEGKGNDAHTVGYCPADVFTCQAIRAHPLHQHEIESVRGAADVWAVAAYVRKVRLQVLDQLRVLWDSLQIREKKVCLHRDDRFVWPKVNIYFHSSDTLCGCI